MKHVFKITVIGLTLSVSGCAQMFIGETSPYRGKDSIIATGKDSGFGNDFLRNGEAAIAYDPDGCQVWIIDNGFEGFASPRFDPVSGMPICNDLYPPGTVLGEYRVGRIPFLNDRVPARGRKTVVLKSGQR